MRRTLRQKITNAERAIGNFFCDGAGDILATEINPRGIVSLALLGSLSLSGGTLAGCVTAGPKVTDSNYINPLRKGDPNTMTLPNGEVIYDLGKDLWEGTYNNYGYGTNKEVVKFNQSGHKFVGLKIGEGNEWVGKGEETLRGILMKDGFRKISIRYREKGWTISSGKIYNQGRRLFIKGPSLEINLNRVSY